MPGVCAGGGRQGAPGEMGGLHVAGLHLPGPGTPQMSPFFFQSSTHAHAHAHLLYNTCPHSHTRMLTRTAGPRHPSLQPWANVPHPICVLTCVHTVAHSYVREHVRTLHVHAHTCTRVPFTVTHWCTRAATHGPHTQPPHLPTHAHSPVRFAPPGAARTRILRGECLWGASVGRGAAGQTASHLSAASLPRPVFVQLVPLPQVRGGCRKNDVGGEGRPLPALIKNFTPPTGPGSSAEPPHPAGQRPKAGFVRRLLGTAGAPLRDGPPPNPEGPGSNLAHGLSPAFPPAGCPSKGQQAPKGPLRALCLLPCPRPYQ